jgi:hypothetical protein
MAKRNRRVPLKERNSSGLATAVRFLEADPWFFRSGYTKAELIRYLCPGKKALARHLCPG